MTTIVYRPAPAERKKQDSAPATWSQAPAPEDFASAEAFLSLMMPDDMVAKAMAELRSAPVTQVKAKDILRASKSGIDNSDAKLPGVQIELDKIKAGKAMNPVLLLQGSPTTKLDLVIADGFHRAHAAYANDDDATIPVVLAKGLFDDRNA